MTKSKLLAALMLAAGISTAAYADAFTDQVVADLQSKGYTRIEIKLFDGTVKVEAIKGTQKLEVTYDRNTGSILKTENERVRAGEDTRPGIEIEDRTGDRRGGDDDDDDGDDDRRGRGGDDDDDHDSDDDHGGHGSDDDDDDDDDHGGDDDDDDDDDDDHGDHGPDHD